MPSGSGTCSACPCLFLSGRKLIEDHGRNKPRRTLKAWHGGLVALKRHDCIKHLLKFLTIQHFHRVQPIVKQ
jgi:hypothetical protein